METNMPTYTIKDTKEDQEWDVVCSWDELQKVLAENQNWKQKLAFPKIVSGSGKDIFAKQSDGFKDLKRNMHKHAGKQSRIKV